MDEAVHLDFAGAEERAEEVETLLVRRHCALPPDQDLVEWAEAKRELPSTDGGGRWRVERVPYLREPLLALSDPRTKEVTLKKSAQSGATIGVLLNWVFYAMDLDPCNILLLFPTDGEAGKFAKKKFTPAYRAMPSLAGLLADPRSRDGDNTTTEKSFPGGSIGIIGGVSSRGLRMVDARRYAADDVDSLDHASDEGDQIFLLRQRAAAQWNAQGLWISSPGDEGSSKISKLYKQADRHGRFHVSCPHCGHMQALRFGEEDTPYGLKWEKQLSLSGRSEHFPETAAYLCEGCGTLIEEHHKYDMVQAGQYLTEAGEPVYDGASATYGFWYNALVALFSRVRWANIVDTFLKAKGDPAELKVVVNTIFAETWDDTKLAVDADSLEARAALYVAADGSRIEVPDGVGVLVAYADVQHDRIELLVRGFGARECSWQVLHQRIHGDTSGPAVYQQLESWRTREYRHASGKPMRILVMGIDSGDGSRADQVYASARAHQKEGVWPTKGSSDRKMREPVRVSKATKQRPVHLLIVNTYAIKATLFSRLRKRIKPGHAPPTGHMHFRAREPEWHNGSDAEYFAQFEREKAKPVRQRDGRYRTDYVKTGDNEAIDLEGGCIAMLRLLQQLDVRFRDHLEELAEEARNPKSGGGSSQGRRRRRGIISKVDR